MKKIFILPILITPIVAHATNPVGPSAVGQGETPVVATVSAPYATAGAETGDTTNVVSASYVKGAYNDAIAAVNKVNADKQGKLLNGSNNHTISSNVVAGSDVGGFVENVLVPGSLDTSSYNGAKSEIAQDMGVQNLDDALISAGVVLDGFNAMGQYKQGKLTDFSTGNEIGSDVIPTEFLDGMQHSVFENNGLANVNSEFTSGYGEPADKALMTAGGVFLVGSQAKEYTDSKRVSAVTTWGDDTHPTKLQLTTALN